jgi:hypothetical protein
MYLPGSVLSIMDLMQEFYHARPRRMEESVLLQHTRGNNHHLAVIIFFVTFFDLLLEHFLRQKMIVAKLPFEIQDRLLDDSRYTPRRINRLFPTLTGTKWSAAVSVMRSRAELDYEDSVAFYDRAREIRNRLVHEGAQWIVPEEMPKQCIEHLNSLVNLFVALHNEYCLTRPPKD